MTCLHASSKPNLQPLKRAIPRLVVLLIQMLLGVRNLDPDLTGCFHEWPLERKDLGRISHPVQANFPSGTCQLDRQVFRMHVQLSPQEQEQSP